jgi:TPP-dependent pyruvate/acetoin dehydrogenase alpha subunit
VTRDELIAFEADIAAEFNAGNIRAPIHLDGGNEDQLIEVFKNIRPTDWVFCSWRSHYRALLHGIPPEKVKAKIMAGHSIALCWPEHRFFSSAIVGGNLPIALGVALSIKWRGGHEKVWAFCGDMTSRGGAFHECAQYATAYSLPLRLIIEDNGLSVCTPTVEVWNNTELTMREYGGIITVLKYKLPWPHSGAGVRVQF